MTLPVSICVPYSPEREASFHAVTLPTLEAARPANVLVSSFGHNANVKRNEAARRSEEPWLFFADDDIILERHALSRMLSLAGASRVAVVYGDFYTLNHPTRMHSLHKAGKWDVERLRRENYISTCSLVRRDIFELVGGFDETIERFQDWDLWLTISEAGFRGAYLDRVIFAAMYGQDGAVTQRDGIHDAMDVIADKHGLEKWWRDAA